MGINTKTVAKWRKRVTVTDIMGSLAALETLRTIAAFGRDTGGSILIADLLGLRFRTLALPNDPGCRCAQIHAVAA